MHFNEFPNCTDTLHKLESDQICGKSPGQH